MGTKLMGIEDMILDAYDPVLLIDVDYLNEKSDYELFSSYVNQLFTLFVQETLCSDILTLESSDDWPEMLIDELGSCDASVSEEICKMYYKHRSQLQFDRVLSELKQAMS